MRQRRKHIVRFLLIALALHCIALLWYHNSENPIPDHTTRWQSAENDGRWYMMGSLKKIDI